MPDKKDVTHEREEHFLSIASSHVWAKVLHERSTPSHFCGLDDNDYTLCMLIYKKRYCLINRNVNLAADSLQKLLQKACLFFKAKVPHKLKR